MILVRSEDGLFFGEVRTLLVQVSGYNVRRATDKPECFWTLEANACASCPKLRRILIPRLSKTYPYAKCLAYDEPLIRYPAYIIMANHGCKDAYELARYDSKEAAIKQVDDMQRFSTTMKDCMFKYDLRERKIKD
jgi:hypothetical protein